MREAETVLGGGVVPAGEVGRHAFVNLVAEGLPVTAELYEGLATLIGRKILHDRYGDRRGSRDLLLETVGAGAFVLGRWRDIADVVIGEEFILGLRALLFRGVEGGLERFFCQLRSLGQPRVVTGEPGGVRLLEGCFGGGAILRPLVALRFHAGRVDLVEGRLVALITIGALVEEGVGTEIFVDRDRIVLVGMALRAGHRGTHEDRVGGVDAVDDGGVTEFFVARAAFVLGHRIAMEGRGDELVFGRLGQQVAGHLLDDELVVRLILVEGLDDPVAVGPDNSAGVGGITGAIGVAGEVEPLTGPVFAVSGLGEEMGDDVRVLGAGEFRDFFGRGRQAGDVEGKSADEDGLGRFWRPGQAFFLLAVSEEGIDGIGFAVLRHGRTGDRFIGPVTSPRRALLDPFLEEGDLCGGNRLMLLGWRHDVIRVGRLDALDQFALVGFAG